jgi:hypothetical protein
MIGMIKSSFKAKNFNLLVDEVYVLKGQIVMDNMILMNVFNCLSDVVKQFMY